MASDTEVANNAAVLIGTESRVLSLNDDRFLARTLLAAWNLNRQSTLREGSWNFSIGRAMLPAEVLPEGRSIHPWETSFPLPTDCLRLLRVIDYNADEWSLEGRAILANQSGPLYVQYVRDVPVTDFDAACANAFAHRLAWKCGTRVAGSSFDETAAEAAYRRALSESRRVDAMENPPIEHHESSWVTARWAGTSDGADWYRL